MSEIHEDEQPRKRIRLTSHDHIDSNRNPTVSLDAIATQNTSHVYAQAPHPDQDQIEKEVKAGITAYITPDAYGFTGILKQRYTDFIVNEILPSGEVLHLKHLGVPKKEPGPFEKEAQNAETAAEAVKPTVHVATPTKESSNANGNTKTAESNVENTEQTSSDKVVEAEPHAGLSEEERAELSTILASETIEFVVALYKKVLKSPDKKAREFNSITSDVINSKDDRTKAHQTIRRIFKSRLETTTGDENTIKIAAAPPLKGQQRNEKFKKQRQGNKAHGKLDWNELGGEYLHFTLYKENKDTMDALYFIASQLKLGIKNMHFAGTKDRRAVTVQRCCLFRVDSERLANVGRTLRNARIGDFEYCRYGIELGDLKGNEFVITLRDCHFPKEEGLNHDERMALGRKVIDEAVSVFKNQGFINFFGLQRFGSFSAGTDEVGIKMLQEDFKGAVDLLLAYSQESLAAANDTNSDSNILVSSDDKNRAKALHIWATDRDATRALEILPRRFSAEMNIIKHLGWVDRRTNRMQYEADWQGALSKIQRNLRLMYVHAYQSLVWNTCAGRRWELFGSRVAPGDLVLIHEHEDAIEEDDDEFDQAGEVIIRPIGTKPKGDFDRARALTKEEAESGKYTILDVVLPLPGWDVEYPRNEIGQYYKEFMASERGGGLDPYKMRRSWKDISLSGGYRKLIAMPKSVGWDVREYVKDDEQMVETDLEKVEGRNRGERDADFINATTTGAVAEGQNAEEGSDAEMKDGDATEAVQAEATQEKKIAVVLKLQLGSSMYATMALRELMKAGGVRHYQADFAGGRR